MNIRDKLSRLDTSSPGQPAHIPKTENWVNDFQQELQVKVLREEKSFILVKENLYPLHSEPFFGEFRENGYRINRLNRITNDMPAPGDDPLNLRHAFFFDTETTGLAGGTGTYAFLVGVGHLELDHIVVRQYLLPDFSHEWLMLKHLNLAMQNFRFTVSFNGKSFDIPLLKSRFILNQMMTVMEEMPHVDILHAARRIWRSRLPACDLQTLERHILQKERVGDIPGEYIPHIYFEFIRKRDALLLRDVLEHNYFDIVNMVLLTMKIAAICEAPQVHLNDPEDRFTLAKYFMQRKQFADVVALLTPIVDAPGNLSKSMFSEAGFLLSMGYKKLSNAPKARHYLLKMIDEQAIDPAVIEELAKYYEHADKDYSCAKAVVERGIKYLEMIREIDPKSRSLKYLPRLKHRHQRIVRKMKLI